MKQLPDVEYLKECFDYNPETGIVTWKVRPRHHFSSDRTMNQTNSERAGLALQTKNVYGAVIVRLMANNCQAKRIIYKMMTGVEAPGSVFTKNRIADDNRWENLYVSKSRPKKSKVKKYPEIQFNRETMHWGSDYLGWYRTPALARRALGVE